MRTLVVGDVHGCAGELQRLLRAVGEAAVVLVGDLYTKGPDPVGVWELMRQRSAKATLGNHDQRLLDLIAGQRQGDDEGLACVRRLDEGAPGWRDHLRALPLFVEQSGWTVVHAGLHPSGDLDLTPPRMAINMRRFPGTGPDDPWWVDAYRGQRRVVYGHDAKRGLVRRERDGRPWMMGLDTGCVYGGQLSGWLVEEDRLVQVPAARVWRAIGR